MISTEAARIWKCYERIWKTPPEIEQAWRRKRSGWPLAGMPNENLAANSLHCPAGRETRPAPQEGWVRFVGVRPQTSGWLKMLMDANLRHAMHSVQRNSRKERVDVWAFRSWRLVGSEPTFANRQRCRGRGYITIFGGGRKFSVEDEVNARMSLQHMRSHTTMDFAHAIVVTGSSDYVSAPASVSGTSYSSLLDPVQS